MNINRSSLKSQIRLGSMIVLLSVLLIASFVCLPQKAYAEESGSVTVTLPNVEIEYFKPETGFTFRLYKVGSFSGDSLIPDPWASKSGANIVLPQPQPDNDKGVYDISNSEYWMGSWMESASTLADYISLCADADKPVQIGSENTLKVTQSFTVRGLDDGLYLLVGDPAVTKTGAYRRWTPVPMYILINTDPSRTVPNMSDVAVKMSCEPVLEKHRVTKLWSGEPDNKDGIRPSAVNIGLYYGGVLKGTAVLNDTNEWTYSWKNSDFGINDEATSGNRWTVTELFEPQSGSSDSGVSAEDLRRLRQNYSFYVTTIKAAAGDQEAEIKPDGLGNVEMFRITNSFTRRSLKLVKTTDSYVDQAYSSEKDNDTIVFELEGYNAAGDKIYHNYASMVLKKTDDRVKETLVSGIPADIVRITAKEVYTGSLRPAKGEQAVKEAVFDSASSTYVVSFNNTYGGTVYSGGVVNRYELDSNNTGYKFTGPVI